MNRIEIPEDYEDRLEAARRAAKRLPGGPARESVERALAAAPARDRYERAADLAERAQALTEELANRTFDGTDPGRVAWVRLDHLGRLRTLSLSPTVDRLSNPAVAAAIEAAWDGAEKTRSEHVLNLERAHPDLLAARVPDRRGDELRDRIAARAADRFAHTTDDDLCSAEVNIEGRLTGFKFLVPNATLDTECEELSATATATVQAAQSQAHEALAALLAPPPA
ncbi:hypothetical protein SAMN05216298_2709 [Glycomyces sambucus]|uniref:YbaB/EbfC DNA-binding family protein n=1 Tax=Glycomyces sambucus TaxID=380244 RepID=A0A1G9H994_9ACTN|nr:hypothetical protein [Glycomyces sambucus]SDL09571.1 hypothetical protein SAMN05216298_2709 [Glycomyces sambucus]